MLWGGGAGGWWLVGLLVVVGVLCGLGGGGGGVDSHPDTDKSELLLVSFKGWYLGFWDHLGSSCPLTAPQA